MTEDVSKICAILKVLVNKHHHGGSPLPKDAVVNFAAVPSDELGAAKETLDELKTSHEYPFVKNMGKRGVLLENSEFPALADYLYDTCDWPQFRIDTNLRHFETDKHDFGE